MFVEVYLTLQEERGVEIELYCTGTEGSRDIALLYRH